MAPMTRKRGKLAASTTAGVMSEGLSGRKRRKKKVKQQIAAAVSSSAPDWSSLPKDIIDTILGRLTILADYDRFGSVCRSWRLASLDPPNRLNRIESKISPTVPLLLLPFRRPPPNSSEETTRSLRRDERSLLRLRIMFCPEATETTPEWLKGPVCYSHQRSAYDLFRRKLLLQDFKLPGFCDNPSGSRGKYLGSSHGWLVYVQLRDDDHLHIRLVNPFYFGGGSLVHGGVICLPPLRCEHLYYHFKVVLSADPALAPDDYVVSLVGFDSFAVVKSGEDSWHSWRIKGIQDVLFFRSIIYIVADSGRIYSFNTMEPPDQHEIRLVMATPPPPHTAAAAGPAPLEEHSNSTATQYYIVESPNNDLLLVYRSKENMFKVYQLLVREDGGGVLLGQAWKEINNLVNTIIYVGRSQSTCIVISPLSSDGLLPGLQENSIYFDGDGLCGFEDCASRHASYEEGTGIFSLHDKSIHQCYHLDRLSSILEVPQPIWFLPSSLPGSWSCHPSSHKCSSIVAMN